MRDYILFIAAMLIFGSNGVFASMLDMSGAQLVLMRTLIGGAVLLLIILISRSRTPRQVLLREKWRLLLSGVCLGSAVFYAALMLVNRKIEGVSGLNLTFIEIIIAAFILLPYVFLTEGGVPLPRDARGIFALLFLCTVNTGLACWMYFSSMNRLPAKAVALLGYFDPVSALVFSAVFLDERLTAVQLAGAVLVLAGALAGQARPRRFTKGGREGIM